ncbi:hypothetical protein C2845_PM05G16830 [Panicum miliaceum]|uniref:Uncharacterized protein n=1 Tax=Panicum miliaceum TaxID=4540 RepID=A0A3L6T5L4_PANMI|nr:hypothetical protein C2845_PM05G16830 [Panicum miliaceum]
MEGGGFDLFSQETMSSGGKVWPSQPSATGPAHTPAPRASLDSLDLNSQAPQGKEFPHLHDYGAYLQGDGEKRAGRGRGSGLLPPRAPRSLGVSNQRAGGGFGWAARGALRAHQLNFGASSAAAGGRGGHVDAMTSWNAHSETVQVSNKEMLKRAADKEAVSVKRCQQLAFECGIEQTSDVPRSLPKGILFWPTKS